VSGLFQSYTVLHTKLIDAHAHGKWNYCVRIVIKITNFETNRRRTSLILEVKADFYVSAQVAVLFLVEMCEPDGSETSHTFSTGRS